MKVCEFNYNLPEELIAQTPIKDRSSSRLLQLDKESGAVSHGIFTDVKNYLSAGDALVLNDSKVIPARIFGVKKQSGALVEFLLLSRRENDVWEMLVKPGKKARPGDEFEFADGKLTLKILEIIEEGIRLGEFSYKGSFYEILDEIGNMPLPPYIHEKLEDKSRYQTVYAENIGSAAAPTAGLHFTPKLLDEIEKMGVHIVKLTLHVGLGTFRPVKEDTVEAHKMHCEEYHITKEAADTLNTVKASGGKIVCVGTTSCRTLESATGDDGIIASGSGATEIFIYPGYKFKAVDKLITNFHLPESTLVMLVSALAGRENVLAAYQEAIDRKYKFFSFGDAMIIY